MLNIVYIEIINICEYYNGYACVATSGIECKEKEVTFTGSVSEPVAHFHLFDAITF